MKWLRRKDGLIQKKLWFAFWPISIEKETRWLEVVYVKRKWYSHSMFNGGYWINLEFIDDNK